MPPMRPPTEITLRSPTEAAPYRRATARYWSWLFAAPDSRDPLLGVYALDRRMARA